ncbi:MAG: PilZ domain-containing protein [Rhodospirillales bacterium]|jgi:hypothetical protein|nr:PilZ domain-containing protein [Rhodospirillales bacterium]MDP6644027.1 PilZ domain-containing protein [Rhodospirillales bacterium]MDP6843624.1 PilZ domain-containing protein [Rhodospirillales bacterium]|tara:strand:+ start:2383 stop:2694 length:312 start_codon:yes stop_codon:yes gene_type:complete
MSDGKSEWEPDRRRFERNSVLADTELILDGKRMACRVTNVSLGGASVEIGMPCERGQSASLVFEKFDAFDGEVVWSIGGACGIKFTGDVSAIGELLTALATYG